MHIRCPHCRNPIELIDETELDEVLCPSCGSGFSLLHDDATASYAAQQQIIAQFELIERVGIGQFGSVWKARDGELDRIVAIKIPRRGQLTSSEVDLFLREARAAAQLKHPNVVSLHEVGRHEGQLYIVSDYIDGANLQEWLAGTRLTPVESAELCETIAIALDHAHEAGVVHRDLKPGNIMMDADGVPHIMDFGLAKREFGEMTMTMDGKVLGTPAYMSPEQASGKSHQADRRSDVYALGVILFEMLTEELPFRGEKRMLLVQIQRDDPPSPRHLNSSVPRDLETICLKCLEKAPASRYPSARELADELARFRERRPIRTRPLSHAGRLWRLCQRNPAVASLSTGLIVVLLGALVAVTSLWVRAARLGKQEARARADAEAAEQIAQREESRAKDLLYASDMKACQLALDSGDYPTVRELLQRQPPSQGKDRRDVEWFFYSRATHPGTALVYHSSEIPNESLPRSTVDWLRRKRVIAENKLDDVPPSNITPDGQLYARLEDETNELEIYRMPAAGSDTFPIRSWKVSPELAQGEILCFSKDSRFAVLSGEGMIQLRDLESGDPPQSFIYTGEACRFANILGQSEYLVASSEGHFRVWSLHTSATVIEVEMDDDVVAAELGPDGSFVAALSDAGGLHVCDLQTKQWVEYANAPAAIDLHLHFEGFQRSEDEPKIATSANGRWIATSSGSPTLTVWNRQNQSFYASVVGHVEAIEQLTFWQDDRQLVSSDKHFSVVWELNSLSDQAPMIFHEENRVEGVGSPVFYVKDKQLCCKFSRSPGDSMAEVKCGSVPEPASTRSERLQYFLSSRVASADWIVASVAGVDGNELVIVDRKKERLHARFEAHESYITELRLSNDGTLLFSACADNIGKVWDISSHSLRWQTTEIDANDSEPVVVMLGATTKVARYPETHVGQFSPDGKYFAFIVGQGRISLCRAMDGREQNCLSGHDNAVKLAFSPDSRRLASMSAEGTIRICDLQKNGQVELMIGSSDATDFIFSPQGKTILVIGDSEIQFWDVATGYVKGEVELPIRVRTDFFGSSDQTLTFDEVALNVTGRIVILSDEAIAPPKIPGCLILGRGDEDEAYKILGASMPSTPRPRTFFDGGLF